MERHVKREEALQRTSRRGLCCDIRRYQNQKFLSLVHRYCDPAGDTLPLGERRVEEMSQMQTVMTDSQSSSVVAVAARV